ncbi:S-layer homology domain-containing protein [Salibacterium sp. K-3]
MKAMKRGALAFIFACSLPGAALANNHPGQIPEHAMENIPDHAKERIPEEAGFSDTDEDYWAAESLERMNAKDIFQGYEDGTFRPGEPVTRMQTIITAVRMLGLEEEAQQKDTDTEVAFEDADQYFGDGKNEWAKGYVLVALEQGLFDTNETTLDANKPAKRIWVAATLVRALGLEDEALDAMTETPDFQDAEAIPAGAVGYANVADEEDIVNGTEEGLFQPNKPITRAQMATVLDRTYDNWLDEEGAAEVRGEFTGVQEEEQVLTLTVNGTEETFTYDEELLVQYEGRYITPDQLQEGDVLSLQVLENAIEDAAVVTDESTEEEPSQEPVESNDVLSVKVEAEYSSDNELEIKYEQFDGEASAKIEEDLEDGERELKGEEALTVMESYLEEWDLQADMGTEQAVDAVKQSLEQPEAIEKLEIKISFAGGATFAHEEENEAERGPDEDEEEDDEDKEDDRDDEDEEDRNDRDD